MGDPAGFTLGQLAAALGATLEGGPTRIVTGVASLDRAGPREISFPHGPPLSRRGPHVARGSLPRRRRRGRPSRAGPPVRSAPSSA